MADSSLTTTTAHDLVTCDALRLTGSTLETGLTSAEAAETTEALWRKSVQARGGTPGWVRLARQSQRRFARAHRGSGGNGLSWRVVDASEIFIVVVVNGIVGFMQESKAEHALEALVKMVVAEAVVEADGKESA